MTKKRKKSRGLRLFRDEYIRMSEAGLLGKRVRHKASGRVGILAGDGKDFNEGVVIQLGEVAPRCMENLRVFREDEFDVVD